jgi:glycosyltransferase involved in cell wall biosynthesis
LPINGNLPKPFGMSASFASFPDDKPLSGRTILQLIPRLDAGGAERTTVDIAAALVDAGARALVATESGRLIPELQAKGGLWIPFPAATKNPISILTNIARLNALCAKEHVDLVHARSRAPAWTAFLATKRSGLPFVTTYHGSYSGTSSLKTLYNSVMARGDVVIANSHYTADLIRHMHPFAVGAIQTIHRGTSMRQFSPAQISLDRVNALREAWEVTRDKRIILLAARLTGWKGQKVLIEATRLLVDRGLDDIVTVLAGDPQGRDHYVAELRAVMDVLNLQNHIRLVGHCTDMPAAFLAASAVAVPSTEPEAFGRSAVEAQAMGTPVVVTELGAVPETVIDIPKNERTGWRIPPGDALALADALYEALTMQASARESLAVRARRHVETQFSLEKMTSDTLEVYRTLLLRENTVRPV